MRIRSSLGVIMAVAAIVAGPVAADPLPEPTAATLTGEVLRSKFGSISAACRGDQSGTYSFRVEGVAAGPYPGTFREQGFITFDHGVVTGIRATFTIESEVGTVTGSKIFRRTFVPLRGVCMGPTIGVVNAPLRYQAEIITPLGIFRDAGISHLSFQATSLKTVSLTETFLSSLETAELILDPPGLSPPVLPGQGCGDDNHVHEDVVLCSLPDAIDEEPAP